MADLSWNQVNAWRLSQHFLAERAEFADRHAVIARIGGLHAQVFSAAELALHARLRRLDAGDLENDLWVERSLVKAWVMRGTLHLVTPGDYPTFLAALEGSLLAFYHKPSWLKYHQVSLEELEAIGAAVQETLSAAPITREQLAEAVVRATRRERLRELLLSSWGALLKPAAVQGSLCFGPPQGQNATFVHPASWLRLEEKPDPEESLKAIARRYLGAYGPASADDFGRWWGIDPRQAAKVLKSLGNEIEAVSVAGWPAWALAASIAEIQSAQSSGCTRLLPIFDPYTVALYRHCKNLLDEKYKALVYRPQGWIAAVVVLDGRIVGIWDSRRGEKQRDAAKLTVALFERPSLELAAGIESEAERLRQFWGSDVHVIYLDILE